MKKGPQYKKAKAKSKDILSEPCQTHLTFAEKELQLLRQAVDKQEKETGTALAQSPEVKKIISIVENFIRRKRLVCYGGTAINNILPSYDQFYQKGAEIPDYDFYSMHALDDAKELADLYVKNGYVEVEAKAGVHHGTFKVFVNYIPVADITDLDATVFKKIQKQAINVDNILYAPANFLRMNMYLELSRPAGDVSRWEKVYKRLALLNKHYPMKNPRCHAIRFMRDFTGKDTVMQNTIYTILRDALIDQGLVFIGGYASSLYGKYLPSTQRRQLQNIPDFDVLSENPADVAQNIKKKLEISGLKHVKINRLAPIGEIVPEHYEVMVGENTVCLIFKPNGCRSYNEISLHGKKIKVASIETLLNFYLTFIYSDRPYFEEDRILCMAQYLFMVQNHNRLSQKGLLKRFPLDCYGEQPSLQSLREEKTRKMEELKNKRNTNEYEEWFLKYTPKTAKNKKAIKPVQVKATTTRKPKRTYKRKGLVSKLLNW